MSSLSLQHVYTHDTRDSSVLPNVGSLVKLTQELAGVGGDVNFLKKDVELQYNHPLPFDSVSMSKAIHHCVLDPNWNGIFFSQIFTQDLWPNCLLSCMEL